MSKVIILNAPPSAGKDVAATWIEAKYGAQHLRFKDGLYKMAAVAAGIDLEVMIRVATDRDLKEERLDLFRIGGMFVSPRQWLIHVSENIVKPLAGKDFFGNALANSIEKDLVVVSDGGFLEEVIPVVMAGHDVYVLRIERDGFSFAGDSRRYLEPCAIYKTHTIENNGSLNAYMNKIFDEVDAILIGEYKV